jgi:hypothetical protein
MNMADYKQELIRLNTFKKWPPSHAIRPTALAKQGFIYTENKDTVVCVFCGLRLNKWRRDDDPFIEHRRHRPDCQFIINPAACGNVPLLPPSSVPVQETNQVD